MVRDNFPLFVRCAEGFEQFRQRSEEEVGLTLHERIAKLEGIAESCSLQAKKSFKPLLDNTNEVRKVQSAMSVLHRIAPILQVPALMRQHIENRRYSQALKTYRRVLVVDRAGSRIELLNHVRLQAEECVLEARRALEARIAQDMKVSVEDLLEGIRDIDELLQLTDLPTVGAETSASAAAAAAKASPASSQQQRGGKKENAQKEALELQHAQGIYQIGSQTIKIRDHPPALACLLLQAAHMSVGVEKIIDDANVQVQRIYSGEGTGGATDGKDGASGVSSPSAAGGDAAGTPSKSPSKASGNQ